MLVKPNPDGFSLPVELESLSLPVKVEVEKKEFYSMHKEFLFSRKKVELNIEVGVGKEDSNGFIMRVPSDFNDVTFARLSKRCHKRIYFPSDYWWNETAPLIFTRRANGMILYVPYNTMLQYSVLWHANTYRYQWIGQDDISPQRACVTVDEMNDIGKEVEELSNELMCWRPYTEIDKNADSNSIYKKSYFADIYYFSQN